MPLLSRQNKTVAYFSLGQNTSMSAGWATPHIGSVVAQLIVNFMLYKSVMTVTSYAFGYVTSAVSLLHDEDSGKSDKADLRIGDAVPVGERYSCKAGTGNNFVLPGRYQWGLCHNHALVYSLVAERIESVVSHAGHHRLSNTPDWIS